MNIEYILWDDCTLFSGWKNKEELKKLYNSKYDYIETVGFVIFENSRHLFVAGTIDKDGSASQLFRIPKKQIIKRKTIKKTKLY